MLCSSSTLHGVQPSNLQEQQDIPVEAAADGSVEWSKRSEVAYDDGQAEATAWRWW
jgi:hypothetical protein